MEKLKYVSVSFDYFRAGDYTNWYDESNYEGSYQDWLENVLIPEMKEKYDSLILYSDGTLYGGKNGVTHDISYNEFEDIDIFYDLASDFGISDIQEAD